MAAIAAKARAQDFLAEAGDIVPVGMDRILREMIADGQIAIIGVDGDKRTWIHHPDPDSALIARLQTLDIDFLKLRAGCRIHVATP